MRNRTNKTSNQKVSALGKTVIKFNMRDDETIRHQARKEYEIAKNFKLSDLPLSKFYSASEMSAKTQFKLSQKTDLTILEVPLTSNEEKNFDIINQIKDFISIQDNIEYKDDKIFKYDSKTTVQRFLVFCK